MLVYPNAGKQMMRSSVINWLVIKQDAWYWILLIHAFKGNGVFVGRTDIKTDEPVGNITQSKLANDCG